ncbi:MAG TPA: ATP-binding protein [Mycobacteriales bacterium]|nr:ATP-binding protein [Mycobacteriales bacterium]
MSGGSSDSGSYDDLPDGVLVADDTGAVIAVNVAAARLLGRDVQDALGRNYREVIPLVDTAGNDWWSCTDPYAGLTTRTGQPERQLTLVKGRGADGHDLLVTARYVREPESRRVVRLVVCFRDAAARERVDRSRADLISTVAHELRSPLTSVKGFTATLLAKWDRFNDEQKKVMLQTVNADADRVTRLLAELLDVSRIDAGRLELRRQVVDVPTAIRRSFAGRVASGEPEDRFVLMVDGDLPEMWLDPDKLDQILGNLVENALKYGDGTVTVEVHASPAGAEVIVRDEGSGIPEELLPRVFGKFWRQAGVRRTGTGLGLFITKGLVEAHGGHISVGHAPSGGAEFRFTLPAGAPTYEG